MRLLTLLWLIVLPSTALAAFDLALVGAHPPSTQAHTAPDFAAMTDVQAKKQAFFEYLTPFVIDANDAVRIERSALLNAENKLIAGEALTASETAQLHLIAKRYQRNRASLTAVTLDNIAPLLNRVDTLPLSLALAQAANESGWGTSRFARQANNYFGIWCYQAGCGLKPSQRDPGRNHEVKKFADVGDNIADYVHNINTNPAYRTLRELRATLRDSEAPLRGVLLAEGLLAYSSRGADYVRSIQELIISNQLEQRSPQLAAQTR